MSKKIALFGLSADPFHLGHAACIEACKIKLPDHVILIMPCKINPLGKVDDLGNQVVPMDAWRRFSILNNYFQNSPYIIVSPYEIEKSEPSYTIDTIEYLQNLNIETLCHSTENINNSEITLIIGTDNFLQLHLWHRWQDILKTAQILIIKRKGTPDVNVNTIDNQELKAEYLNGLHTKKISIFEGPQLEISSRMIKQRLREGASRKELLRYLPKLVLDEICNNI